VEHLQTRWSICKLGEALVQGGAFPHYDRHMLIQHIKDRFGNYIGSNVLCEIFIKANVCKKNNKWKSSEANTWSMIGQ